MTPPLEKAIRSVLLPATWLCFLSTIQLVLADGIAMRVKADRFDVVAGGEVTLKLTGDLQSLLNSVGPKNAANDVTTALGPDDAVGEARLGSSATTIAILGTNRNEVRFFVPVEIGLNQKHEIDYKVSLSITNERLNALIPGHVILTVYPRSTPKVDAVNDAPLKRTAYVRTHQPFTVSGSGFLAPASQITFRLLPKRLVDGEVPAPYEVKASSVAPDGTSFTAVFNGSPPPPCGLHEFEVLIWGRQAYRQATFIWVEDLTRFTSSNRWIVIGIALLPVVLFAFILVRLFRRIGHTYSDGHSPQGGLFRLVKWHEILFVDPATNTYSLSRLQFALWLATVVFCYGFVFVARSIVAEEWEYPGFDGAELALLISLGTLVGSSATTAIVGTKGAGELTPKWRDLIVHGGVLAFDRIQQLVWTIIAIVIFVVIVVRTDGSRVALPNIPDDLLKLMGLSSVGYLAGKAARKPGPVISDVTKDGAGLLVQGLNLSVNARVLIDTEVVAKSMIDPDQTKMDSAGESTTVLHIKGTDLNLPKKGLTIVNPDGQEANWADKPPFSAPATPPKPS